MRKAAFGLANIIIVTMMFVSIVIASEEDKMPEYVGSQTCQPCHSETHKIWKSSGHANMLVPISDKDDLPLEIAKAPKNLQTELEKADYMVAGTLFISADPSIRH